MRTFVKAMATVYLVLGTVVVLAQDSPTTGQDQIPKNAVRLTYAGDTSKDYRSLGASGQAVLFERPEKLSFVEAVQIFAARYGYPQPPAEDFHLYLLNDKFQILKDLPYPYGMIERITESGELRWYTLLTPSIEVPKRFYVALSFNPHQTKGIYLGLDKNVKQAHSFMGLPDSGFQPVKETADWMVRVYMTEQPSGAKGIQRLADWGQAVVENPFKGCIEAKYDTGKSGGMQSYGGSGPAIRSRFADFLKDTSAKNAKLKGLRLYGSRYGSGYDTKETTLKVLFLDAQGKSVIQNAFPYALFSYKEKWVDLVLPKPIPLDFLAGTDGTVTIAFDPEAHQYKGIYFHYNKNPKTTHSLAGSVASGFKEVTDREWMIRAYLTTE